MCNLKTSQVNLVEMIASQIIWNPYFSWFSWVDRCILLSVKTMHILYYLYSQTAHLEDPKRTESILYIKRNLYRLLKTVILI